jgi:sortase A
VHIVLRVLEYTLLLIGCAAIGWYTWSRVASAREQAALSRELDHVAAPAAAPSTAAPVSRSLVGRIQIPRLNLSAVAREGVDVTTLRLAVGHIPGTGLPGEPGNAGFAAHRDTFFRPLRSVRKGDEVIVTTPGGVYRYAVTGTRIVQPDDMSVLNPSAGATLTLVTCYPFDFVGSAPQRFIVFAALREPVNP